MHFQFLIEDMSGEIFIRHVMDKLRREGNDFTYDTKAFKGIGGFKNTCKVKDIKTNKLLSDLPLFLKAFDKHFYQFEACVFVVLDNDDREALFKAYPLSKENKYKDYKQDSICGTWEFLADIIYKGGIKEFKKDCPTYREVGKYKAEWAGKIGELMNLNQNLSPSFQHLIQELRKRLITA